jgi:rhodanese-related sulfurtransferase
MFNWLKKFRTPSISAHTLKNEYLTNKKNHYFLDVRTSAEFKMRSIPGFVNIPLNQLPEKLDKIPKNKEIVVICQSGMRSSRACSILKKSGYQVTNVSGGMGTYR